jgi:hypothetical protein
MKWAFRHIHEYYSPQNISTIKYLFMKNAWKTKMITSRRTSCGPLTGRGPAVEKHWDRASNFVPSNSKDLPSVIIMTPVFCHMTLYRTAHTNKYFGEACSFHLQGNQFIILGLPKIKAALFRALVTLYNVHVVISRQDNLQKACRFIILSEEHRLSLHVSSSFVLT